MKKTFKVHFRDGNIKLFEAENIANVLNYLLYVYDPQYKATDIIKIEEVENEDTSR